MAELAALRKTFDAWREGPTTAARELQWLAEALEERGHAAFVLGGAIREAHLRGPDATPKDLDVVVDIDSVDQLLVLDGFDHVHANSFGGLRGLRNDVVFDLWPLKSTWAFVHGHVQDVTFENLPATTSLTIEAIAAQVACGNALYDAGFLQSIYDRVIDVNLEPLPRPKQVFGRALALADRMQFRFGSRLQALMTSGCNDRRSSRR